MYNLKSISFAKKVSLTLLVLLCFAYQTGWAQTVSNSSCFTFSVATTSNYCDTNFCDDAPNAGRCTTYCYEVTVTNTGCSGLTINRLIMTTPGDQYYDCRAICSPTGDFFTHLYGETVEIDECSWAGPRYLEYVGNGGNGLPYLGTAKFIICRKAQIISGSPITYTFSCGCNCGSTPCTDGSITF